MTYKTLVLSLNEIERVDALLKAAASLSGGQQAHLIGVYVIPAPAVYPAVGPYVVPEVFDGLTRFFEEQSHAVKSKFEAALKAQGLAGQWLEVKALAPVISETLCDIGRIADLVLVSEANRQGKNGVELDFVENVILGSGRPVLIMPRSGDGSLDLRLVVCAYNGSKEAARAVHDAIPILKSARDVLLLWIDPPAGDETARPPAAEMAEALLRHAIPARAETMASHGANPAEAVMRKTAELGAGLLVMGAYGHSRIREFVLGGATRHALTNLAVPLLMSH